MKKHLAFKLLSLSFVLSLSACGYGLKEVYDGIPYNSTNFLANYFTDWDKSVDYRKKESSKINKELPERVLDQEKDLVFTRLENVDYEEDYKNYQKCEPNWFEYDYVWDKEDPVSLGKKAYGPAVSLNKADNSFKQGVRSKLFDGQMFCNGDFQQARVQVGSITSDYDGFGFQFGKECFSSSYFMCNFKCSTVTDKNQNLQNTLYTNLTIKLGFYLKNDTGFTYVPVSYSIEKVPTNSGDDHAQWYEDEAKWYRGRIQEYVCFGFKLHDDEDKDNKYLDLSRLAGISFQYQLDEIVETKTTYDEHGKPIGTEEVPFVPPVGETAYHSVMLYEVSLPHSTWH